MFVIVQRRPFWVCIFTLLTWRLRAPGWWSSSASGASNTAPPTQSESGTQGRESCATLQVLIPGRLCVWVHFVLHQILSQIAGENLMLCAKMLHYLCTNGISWQIQIRRTYWMLHVSVLRIRFLKKNVEPDPTGNNAYTYKVK